MNILALVGVVFALAGTVFGIMEAVVKEFVNVFLPLDSTSDPELSCRIGNLGVFTSTYDPSCLSAAVLAESHLPTQSFTSATTKFKLLFPAQENFMKDILPINDALIDQFGAAGNLPQSFIDSLKSTLALATPAFSNCAKYMDDLQTGQITLFSTFDPILTGALASQAVSPVMSQLVDNLGPALNSIRASGANSTLVAVVFSAIALAEPSLAGTCGVELDTIFNATSEPCVVGVFQNVAASFQTTSPVTSGLLSGIAGKISLSCGSINFCIGGLTYALTSTLFAPIDANSPCEIAPGTCNTIINLLGIFSAVVGELVEINDAFAPLAPTAGAAFGIILLTAGYFSGQIATLDDSQIINELGTLLPASLVTDFYPPTFTTPEFEPCVIQSLAADLLASVTGSRLADVPDVLHGDNCTFHDFFTAASALLVATDPTNSFVGLLTDLQFLYDNCAPFETDPADCQKFFPAFFVNADYSLGLDLSQFQGEGDAIFDQAVSHCEDDNVDISKMSTAQILVPIAIVCIGLSVVAGAISAFTEHKIATIAACVLSLAGGVLNLAALLDVKSAPVYKLVGQPPELLSPLYKAGITQIYGLIFIACGVIAAILFGVSLLSCLKREGDAKDVKDLAA